MTYEKPKIQQGREKMQLTRLAARTRRCHTLSVLHDQNIGEHTFNALAILDFIAPDCDKLLWQALLYHDVPEAITGDIPATAKWDHADLESALKKAETLIREEYHILFQLQPHESMLVKYADMMELVLYGIEEMRMGNKDFKMVVKKIFVAMHARELVDLNFTTRLLYESAFQDFVTAGGSSDA